MSSAPSVSLHALKKDEEERIDALRGALFFLIFLGHFLTGTLEGLPGVPLLIDRALHHGEQGVNVFFVLSGFLILHSYARGLNAPANFRATAAFYVKRIFRIFPVWIVVLSFSAWLSGAGLKTYLWNLFFLFGLTPYHVTDLLVVPSWSLYVEEIFYLSFPLLIFIYRKKMTVSALIAFCFLFVVQRAVVDLPEGVSYNTPFNTFQYFLFGMLVYVYIPKIREMACSRIFFYTCLLATVLASALYTTTELVACYAALSFLMIFKSPPEFSRILTFLFRLPGKMCYSLYLTHTLSYLAAGWMAIKLFEPPTHVSDPSIIFQFFASLLVTLLASTILYYLVERPFMIYGKRLTTKPIFFKQTETVTENDPEWQGPINKKAADF